MAFSKITLILSSAVVIPKVLTYYPSNLTKG